MNQFSEFRLKEDTDLEEKQLEVIQTSTIFKEEERDERNSLVSLMLDHSRKYWNSGLGEAGVCSKTIDSSGESDWNAARIPQLLSDDVQYEGCGELLYKCK
mgnify:CR=1 FL=1